MATPPSPHYANPFSVPPSSPPAARGPEPDRKSDDASPSAPPHANSVQVDSLSSGTPDGCCEKTSCCDWLASCCKSICCFFCNMCSTTSAPVGRVARAERPAGDIEAGTEPHSLSLQHPVVDPPVQNPTEATQQEIRAQHLPDEVNALLINYRNWPIHNVIIRFSHVEGYPLQVIITRKANKNDIKYFNYKDKKATDSKTLEHLEASLK